MRVKAIWLLLAAAGAVEPLWAESSLKPQNQDETEHSSTLPVVRVRAAQKKGASLYLQADDIARRPTRNGTITELLRNHPGVQFANTANESTHAGEIAPELVSFHGQPYYNNLFLLDGLSANDIMNPGAANGGYITPEKQFEARDQLFLAPGAPEAFQVDSSLLKDVAVYDSNAPAKYSRFSGGVIDARLKDPDPERAGGQVGWRTTRSSWTRFHLGEYQDRDEFEAANAENDVQPRFVKHSYNLSLNQPLGKNAALLAGYTRTQSAIPEYHSILGRWQKERRRSETWLLKGLYRFSPQQQISASLMYSPHQSVYFRNNADKGRYVAHGGGWRLQLEADNAFDWGKIRSTLAYTHNRNRIAYDAGHDSYVWLGSKYIAGSRRIDWCSIRDRNGDCTYAITGGLGELESHTATWSLKQEYGIRALDWGAARHKIDFGWQADIARAKSRRPQDARFFQTYFAPQNGYPDNITHVSPDCIDCIAGEQYANRYWVSKAHSTAVGASHYSLWLADDIRWGRWTLQPGFNLSYDSHLRNWNAAPRFAFEHRFISDGRLALSGGLNRYYAGSMLAYALRAAIPRSEIYKRIRDPQHGESGWTFENYSPVPAYRSGSLKTPYSDEANLGLRWQFAGQLFEAKYVHRSSRRQFVPLRNARDNSYTLTNDGSGHSNHFSFSLQSAEPYRWHGLNLGYRLGARYQKHRSSHHGNYDSSLVQEVANGRTTFYLYEGRRYRSIAELPPFDFNRLWEAFAEVQTDIPAWHLSWTHSLNFRSGYKNYLRYGVRECSQSSQPAACDGWNGYVYDYRPKKFKHALTLDWRLRLALPVRKSRSFELSLDVLNVLDNKNATSSSQSAYLGGINNPALAAYGGIQSPTSYETGRQFWLGAAYRW